MHGSPTPRSPKSSQYTAFASTKKGRSVTARLIVRRGSANEQKAAAARTSCPACVHTRSSPIRRSCWFQAEGQHRDHAIHSEQVFPDSPAAAGSYAVPGRCCELRRGCDRGRKQKRNNENRRMGEDMKRSEEREEKEDEEPDGKVDERTRTETGRGKIQNAKARGQWHWEQEWLMNLSARPEARPPQATPGTSPDRSASPQRPSRPPEPPPTRARRKEPGQSSRRTEQASGGSPRPDTSETPCVQKGIEDRKRVYRELGPVESAWGAVPGIGLLLARFPRPLGRTRRASSRARRSRVLDTLRAVRVPEAQGRRIVLAAPV